MNIRKLCAATVLGAGLSIMAAAPALASVTPGAFCKDRQAGTYGNSADGDTYICIKRAGDIRHRWIPVAADEPSPDDYDPSEDNITAPKANPELPKTGPGDGLIAAITAGSLITAGTGAVVLTRRRRRRFVA